MIMIIDGKRYDTETADCVYAWSNNHFVSDLGHRSKSLYRTKSGAWFLHHEGGAMSDMAVSVGSNEYGGSEKIEPVSEDDAFGFLQRHSDDADAMKTIEKYFASRVEDA